MKKVLTLALAGISFGTSALAQDVLSAPTPEKAPLSYKSKNGHEMLPQKGDWSLGISATSFLNYLGNLANNNANNAAPTFTASNAPNLFSIGGIGSGYAVTAKYMVKSDMAYRVRFQANFGSNTYRNMVAKNDTGFNYLKPKFVEDNAKVGMHSVLLGAGFEKRRGNGRFQGIYGAEALLGFSGGKTTYTYGNVIDTLYLHPATTVDFATGTVADTNMRVKETKTGSSFLFGVRGFGGIEYFIAPKISLGGEIGYSIGFSSNGQSQRTDEVFDPIAKKSASIVTDGYKASGLKSFGLGLDNMNAGINLHFYF